MPYCYYCLVMRSIYIGIAISAIMSSGTAYLLDRYRHRKDTILVELPPNDPFEGVFSEKEELDNGRNESYVETTGSGDTG